MLASMWTRSALTVGFLALAAVGYVFDERDERFTTNRNSPVVLPLPDESDAFTFAVFGDRTGGPAEGVRVLGQAVADVNLIRPDLVMTVGDLVQGYNEAPEWMEQMREYKRVMGGLECPWFPVSGNHDIYWRGQGTKPTGEHESDYEQNFGPLWYAFEHKNSWFVALYSDEGDPATGEKNFNKPACQRMSDEQFAWLEATLARARGAKHVFVFLHHPRWLENNYGEDWRRVHELLRRAGNVSAVFAGHIHHMRYDGKRDGVEYFTLATVGGDQSALVPEAGYLHQYSLVTVRDSGIDVSAFPVGSAIDPRALTGELVDQTTELARKLAPRLEGALKFGNDLSLDGQLRFELSNPSDRAIEIDLAPASFDSRWRTTPDHAHMKIAAGSTATAKFRCERPAQTLDEALRPLEVQLRVDYLGERLRVPLPMRALAAPIDLSTIPAPPPSATDRALMLDGKDAHLSLANSAFPLPDGPFTVELWLNASKFKSRQGLICKTEQSEFGLFANDGKPGFTVHLGGRYASANATQPIPTRTWTHVAGVFDGETVSVYVDGVQVASTPARGARKRNELPLIVGGDVSAGGAANSLLDGAIDEVRVSSVARYRGDRRFQPATRFVEDTDTLLLLHMDGDVGPWAFDASTRHAHPLRVGDAKCRAR